MAQKTDAELQTERGVIETETVTHANTTTRVGDMLENIIDSKVNNQGNSTIAGVKTFSSDPIIPDEAYDATAWDGSLEPPTKNAVRDKIESMGSGGHVIEDEGTPLTQRANMNFAGAGVTVTDAGGKTVVTIPGGSGTVASQATTNTGTNDTEFVSPLKLKNRDAAVTALTDGASIDITSDKCTLSTSSAARTFTISHTGDKISMLVTLNLTSSVFTFWASTLCVSEGVASGDNTCSLAGVSGDKYLISIEKIGSTYLLFCKNVGQ